MTRSYLVFWEIITVEWLCGPGRQWGWVKGNQFADSCIDGGQSLQQRISDILVFACLFSNKICKYTTIFENLFAVFCCYVLCTMYNATLLYSIVKVCASLDIIWNCIEKFKDLILKYISIEFLLISMPINCCM